MTLLDFENKKVTDYLFNLESSTVNIRGNRDHLI